MDFRHHLEAISPDSTTDERVKYLESLRASVKDLQGQVNAFLTQKMEEDRTVFGKGPGVDDHKEEENYGEDGTQET